MSRVTAAERNAALRVLETLFETNALPAVILAPAIDATRAIAVDVAVTTSLADTATLYKRTKRTRDTENLYEPCADDDDETRTAKRRRCDAVRESLAGHLEILESLHQLPVLSNRRFDPRRALPLEKQPSVPALFMSEVEESKVFANVKESTKKFVERNHLSHAFNWHQRRLLHGFLTDVDGWGAYEANLVRPKNWSAFARFLRAYNVMTALGRTVVRAHFEAHVRAQRQ